MDRTEKKKVNSEIEDIKWNINTCVAQRQLLVREKTEVTEETSESCLGSTETKLTHNFRNESRS